MRVARLLVKSRHVTRIYGSFDIHVAVAVRVGRNTGPGVVDVELHAVESLTRRGADANEKPGKFVGWLEPPDAQQLRPLLGRYGKLLGVFIAGPGVVNLLNGGQKNERKHIQVLFRTTPATFSEPIMYTTLVAGAVLHQAAGPTAVLG